MRAVPALAHPSAPFSTLRPAAQRTGATSASIQGLLESPRAKRGLLSGILESVGDFLGFGNNQAHPSDPKDTGKGGASSTGGNHEPTGVRPPVDLPPPPAHVPPVSYPAPGGGGQVEQPTSSTMPPASVSSASSGSAGTEPEAASHSTSAPAAMNVVPIVSTAQPPRESQSVTDIYGGPSTSHTAAPGWPSSSGSVSSAPSPTDPPITAEHTKQFPLAAAAAIGAVLGFVVVSALFWAVWLALRKRRRAYPEFASVHPNRMHSVVSVSEADENPFAHPCDGKEDDPFDAALCRASTARSLASTLSV